MSFDAFVPFPAAHSSTFVTGIPRGGAMSRTIVPPSGNLKDLTSLNFATNPALASLIAGSFAGAIGVGIAFPLDTLKTKSQVLASSGGGGSGAVAVEGGELSPEDMNMFQLMAYIYQMEGIGGFFGGVKAMMVGQAIIKSVAFSANAVALTYLTTQMSGLGNTLSLLLAAMFSGFVTSFLVAPIERIKVMMQASNQYNNEFECVQALLKSPQGIYGLLSRGLGPTLAREVPSYGIYFVVYGTLMQTPLATTLGSPFAPLLFGALTGMACWIPVYPIDVVKTLVQNSDGSEQYNSWQVAKQLYQDRGISGFFDGLTPKMLRAAVNHSVTFYVYDIILQW
eukprot:CAMPEP_0194213720 /NCGR_PEP_ID=MMETSP0156-20130528/14515_1 /TAXON_ID=33649 /ORGANISM="Thalassionema nitzschioides, Strain L26-B" /LENGTH=337 /DNA_ID=CAMNT_0038941817 /DNA_START=144 /DNA_END=1155 /DNA_ORIENTATION=-